MDEKEVSKSKLKQTIFTPNEKPQQENFAEIIKAWLDKKFIHRKTRLTINQIIALTTLKSLADKYKIKCIQTLIDNFVSYKLSEGGKSSEELVEILRSREQVDENDTLMKAIEPFLK